MPAEITEIRTFQDLQAYVHQTLCRKENLVAELFVTRTTPLLQGERQCGLQFTLQGPRCVKLGAVWAADQNVVYYYDTRGRRYRKERLPHRLSDEAAAA